MQNKIGKILMAAGICLLAAALVLVLHNRHQARQAELAAQQLLQQLDQEIQQRHPTPEPLSPVTMPPASVPAPTEPSETRPTQPQPMETVRIDGLDYIGDLQIPDLGIALPVLADWDYDLLRLAPCRFAGDQSTEDLVIMAHNYTTHFGYLSTLTEGVKIYFRDVNQKVTAYEVAAIENLQSGQVEDMTAGEYPLTLFTCTYSGQTRITVRCQKCN